MKKKASNAELSAVLEILSNIVRSDDGRWPVRVGFRVVQNVEALTAATSAYKKERDAIIRSFSPDGKKISSGDPGYDECLAQLRELDSIETEAEVQPIAWEDLKEMQLPVRQIVGLRFFLEEVPE